MSEIMMLNPNEITPYPNNPRVNDASVDAVVNSIKEFGFQNPIIVDTGMVIIAGHTRHKAALRMGLEEVPVIVAENLTDEQVKAYRLADNKTSELSGWDFNLLDQELMEIIDIDMTEFGFIETDVPDFEEALDRFGGDSMDIQGSISDSFAVTLVINKEYEDLVKEYLKKYKNEGLVELLISALEAL